MKYEILTPSTGKKVVYETAEGHHDELIALLKAGEKIRWNTLPPQAPEGGGEE